MHYVRNMCNSHRNKTATNIDRLKYRYDGGEVLDNKSTSSKGDTDTVILTYKISWEL